MATIQIDINRITLAEAAEAERQSGKDFGTLLVGRVNRHMLAMFIHGLRQSPSYESAPSWRELGDQPLFDSLSSTSPASPDGVLPKSES